MSVKASSLANPQPLFAVIHNRYVRVTLKLNLYEPSSVELTICILHGPSRSDTALNAHEAKESTAKSKLEHKMWGLNNMRG